ncbi:MAG: hypothetical protein AABY07_10945 [Nanoarchaeota archaeon]
MNKTCNKCNKEQGINNFSKHPKMKDGYLNICKSCNNQQRNKKNLRIGKVKYTKDNPKHNLIGQRFSNLLVLNWIQKEANNGWKKTFWICLCDCGKETTINQGDLLNGKTKSCGCQQGIAAKENGKLGGWKEHTHSGRNLKREKNGNWNGIGDIHGTYFANIRENAKKRKLDIQITIEEIWDKFLEQDGKCALSGVNIYFGKLLKDETTASLDRIDSNKGYTLNNIQWIHKDLNQMKMEFPQDKFFNWCKLITQHNML